MIIKKFTDDWKWWIWTYVKSNNNKEDIFSVLLNHEEIYKQGRDYYTMRFNK